MFNLYMNSMTSYNVLGAIKQNELW